jgi:hypothetical protein
MAFDTGDIAPDVLPDVLQDSLRVVLCGSAVGTASAKAGAYYAHQQNKFWKILHETGLTPALLRPAQYCELPRYGIGLTDFVKTHSGMDHEIPLTELAEQSRARLRTSMMKFRRRSSRSPARWRDNNSSAASAPMPADRARRHNANLDPALDLRCGQRQLAAGGVASICQRSESDGGVNVCFPFSPALLRGPFAIITCDRCRSR